MKIFVLLLGSTISMYAGTVVFSENFSGATPDPGGTPYGVGAISGTQFNVSSGTIDIVGVVNGSYFTCADNPAGNCLDLLGSFGELGQITSVPTFNLSAGATYTLSYGVLIQGVGSGTESYSVDLGGITQMETATTSVQDASLTFTPVSSVSGASLVFTQLTALDAVHGAVIDNIVLSEDSAPPSGVPEPSSLAMIFGGLGALGALRRIRRARRSYS